MAEKLTRVGLEEFYNTVEEFVGILTETYGSIGNCNNEAMWDMWAGCENVLSAIDRMIP